MDGIEITDFTPEMLEAAGYLSHNAWFDELDEGTPEQQRIVYQYLVRYYYCPQSPFNVAACRDGRLLGFFLAKSAGCGRSIGDAFLAQWNGNPVMGILLRYKEYLDGSQAYEEKLVQPGDLQGLLFVSSLPGSGKLLLGELRRRALQNHCSHLILWTDDSCSKDYYPNHGFTLLASRPAPVPYFPSIKNTLVYRKAF